MTLCQTDDDEAEKKGSAPKSRFWGEKYDLSLGAEQALLQQRIDKKKVKQKPVFVFVLIAAAVLVGRENIFANGIIKILVVIFGRKRKNNRSHYSKLEQKKSTNKSCSVWLTIPNPSV